VRAYWPTHPASQPSPSSSWAAASLRNHGTNHIHSTATQYSAQHRQATRARQGYRRPRHGVIVSVPGSKSGRRAGACGVPASAIASLRGWWLSNLATFFICKDSRERTGTRNRSVRVQSSNILAASVAGLQPQPTGRAAEVLQHHLFGQTSYDQRLLQM